MKFSVETLMAYTDGELDSAVRASIEAEMARDPEVARAVALQLEQRDALQAKLRAAFDGALTEAVPARLLATAENSSPQGAVTELARARSEKQARRESRRWSYPQWGAIAASLLLGVIVGRTAFLADDEPFAEVRGQLLARGPLNAALTEESGGSIDRESGIQLGVSYLAKNGDYCRTFTLKDEQMLAGLACRRDREWAIDALTRTKAEASGAYRMAGAAVPALILGLVENTIAGDPLDAEQEAEARARGWER